MQHLSNISSLCADLEKFNICKLKKRKVLYKDNNMMSISNNNKKHKIDENTYEINSTNKDSSPLRFIINKNMCYEGNNKDISVSVERTINVNNDCLSVIMSFLPLKDIVNNDIFKSLLSSHKRIRNTIETINDMQDIINTNGFTNIKCIVDFKNTFLDERVIDKFDNPKQIIKLIINNNFTSIPRTLYNLEYLDISYSNITTIPVELNNLIELNCNNSYIKELPKLEKIKKISCKRTNIKSIPEYLISLEELDCSSNNIKILPSNLRKIKKLNCYETNIRVIPSEYINLEELNCEYTGIDTVPNLEKLKILNIFF
jgi:Leucine-rich repeat (LRR) protein